MPEPSDIERAFAVFGLRKSASLEDVRQAYLDLTQIWHPDRFPGNDRLRTKANRMMGRINDAYSILEKHFEAIPESESPELDSTTSLPNSYAEAAWKFVIDFTMKLGELVSDKVENRLAKPNWVRIGIALSGLIPAQICSAWIVFTFLGFSEHSSSLKYPQRFTLVDSFGNQVTDSSIIDTSRYRVHGKAGSDFAYLADELLVKKNETGSINKEAIVVSNRDEYEQFEKDLERDRADKAIQSRRANSLWLVLTLILLAVSWRASKEAYRRIPHSARIAFSTIGWVSLALTVALWILIQQLA